MLDVPNIMRHIFPTDYMCVSCNLHMVTLWGKFKSCNWDYEVNKKFVMGIEKVRGIATVQF